MKGIGRQHRYPPVPEISTYSHKTAIYYLLTRWQSRALAQNWINILTKELQTSPSDSFKTTDVSSSCNHLVMNPVNSISDILEHAPEGHEEVSIFKPCFTAVGRKERL